MRKCVPLGFLLTFAAALCGSQSARAQAAVDTPTAGTATVGAPVVPGVAASLSVIEQLLGSAGQVAQGGLTAGSANLNANIGRLSPSTSTGSGVSGSGGQARQGRPAARRLRDSA